MLALLSPPTSSDSVDESRLERPRPSSSTAELKVLRGFADYLLEKKQQKRNVKSIRPLRDKKSVELSDHRPVGKKRKEEKEQKEKRRRKSLVERLQEKLVFARRCLLAGCYAALALYVVALWQRDTLCYYL